MALKNIVYLSAENYVTLKETGTVTINGQTINYSEDDVYCVPDETEEKIAELQAELTTHSEKIGGLQTSIQNLLLEEVFTVGSRYIQFPDEPTPDVRLGGEWELDEDATDKFLVGAGNLYTLGSTGGSADAVVVRHGDHLLTSENELLSGEFGNANMYLNSPVMTEFGDKARGWNRWSGNEMYPAGKEVGEDGTGKNMPPYLAVNIWKRIA